MNLLARQIYEFGPFRVDVKRRLLLKGQVQVPLSSKAFDTLLTLIESGGEVLEKDFLLNRIWPDTTVEEKNLTIAVSAVRKALGETPSQHQFIVTVPGRGYKFVAGVRELINEDNDFVVEKLTSKQITIEEIESTEPQPELINPSDGQRLLPPMALSNWRRFRASTIILGISGALVVLAILYFQFYRRSGPSLPPNPRVGSLAVLPFKSWDTRDDDKYLGLGITDAVITRLSNIDQVIVRPTEAVRKYYGVEQDAVAAGREMKVDSVLAGNIQRAPDGVRVTVQLVRVSDGKPIWGETFDERVDNLFVLEDSISRRVASALTLTLTTRESERLAKRYTENTQAYQLYLKGRYYSSNWTLDGFHKAVGYFNDAIAVDPNYALAYAGLADTYYRNATVHLPLKEAVPKARSAAMQALRLDDTLAEAHTSLAMIKFRYDWDWTGAESEFKRAIELNQNYATAHQWYSEYLAARGRTDEAVAEGKRAEQIDPISPEVGWDLGLALFLGRRYDQAIEQFKRTIDLNPDFWLPHSFLAFCYGEKGEFDKAFAEYSKALALDDNEDTLSHMAYIDVKAGRRTEAQKILDELMRRQQRKEVSPFYIAAVYFALDDKDQGFKWLDKAYNEKAELLVFLKFAPNFQMVNSDPRFKKVVADVGL
jgi:DNA-binding winged helix-turn-helix (wHTH) protein/TolB-like protein